MAKNKRKHNYLTEEVLVEKMQSGEIGWLEYVNRHSSQWQHEYAEYCKKNNLLIDDSTAEQFVAYKNAQLEEAMLVGEA